MQRASAGGIRGHLLGHPEPNATADQAQPEHHVLLLGTVEPRHGVSEEAWMDEERGKSRQGVMLRHDVWFALTSAEMPPMPPVLRRASLYSSGTSLRKTVSRLKAGSSAGSPCNVNHRHGIRYVGCK